jgi:hypothetical protein
MDEQIQNAQAAAASPANGAPAAREALAQQNAQHAQIVDDGGVAAGRQKLAGMLGIDVAELDKRSAARDARTTAKSSAPTAAPSELEARRLALTKELTSSKLTSAERAEKMRELRQVLAAGETEDEKAARGSLTLKERREAHGLSDPKQLVPWQVADYNENFSAHEVGLLDIAHEHGLDNKLTGAVRDAAIDLAFKVADSGKPLTDQALKAELERLRVPPSARPALIKAWRRLEGAE